MDLRGGRMRKWRNEVGRRCRVTGRRTAGTKCFCGFFGEGEEERVWELFGGG